jgi:hypothetical protein
MAIQEQMERQLEGGDTGSALDTLRLMEQERSTVGEPVAAVAAREQQLRQRQPLPGWDNPQPAPALVQPPAGGPAQTPAQTEEADVILPSGEQVTVIIPVGMTDEEVKQHLKAMGELPPDPAGAGGEPERYRLGAALQGASMGTGDEWTAAITAAAAKAATWLPGQQAGEDSTYADIYQDVLESERSKLQDYRKAHPVEATAYEIGGAMVPALASGGSAAPLTVGRAAAQGAGWGGLYGIGATDPSTSLSAGEQVSERVKGGGMGAAVGGAVGGVIGTGVKGYQAASASRAKANVRKQMSTMQGRQTVLDDVTDEVTTRMAGGESRIDAVNNTLKSKHLNASDYRDLMIHNSGPINFGKTRGQAMDDIVAKQDILNNTVIMGTIPVIDHVIRPIATRIERWSPAVAQKLRNYEARTHFDYHDWSTAARPWAEAVRKIDKEPLREMTRHLYNGRFDEARAIMQREGGPELLDQFRVVEDILAHIRSQMRRVGIKDKDIPNYFPRTVKDLKGLKAALGTEELKGVDAYLRRVKDPVRAMEMYMKANPKVKERALRRRKVSEIDEEIDQFYSSLGTSLDRHFRDSTSLVRRREFLGKYAEVTDKGAEDIEGGITDMVDDLLDVADPEGRDEIARLLKARFVAGEKNMYGWLQNIRNIGHTALLANPVSATTQLADLGPTAWVYGLGKTSMATVKNTTGKGKRMFNADDLGVMEQMVQEINETGAGLSTKVLEKGLRYSGFRAMDKFGKDAIITASYDKAARMARSFHGKKQLAKDLRASWGDETGQLIQDLADGKRSELVRLYLFTQLSKMQPITKSEMPQMYLEMPNGRILYQLMSWTIKQVDVMRQEILGTAQKVLQKGGMKKAGGTAKELATKMVAGYMFIGGMGVASDEAKRFISGKESAFQGVGYRPTELGERMMQQMSKAMFKNYLGDHDVGRAAEKFLQISVPLGEVTARLGKQALEAADGKHDPVQRAQAMDKLSREMVGFMPIFGKLYAMWFMGGAREFNKKARDERRKEYMEKFKR